MPFNQGRRLVKTPLRDIEIHKMSCVSGLVWHRFLGLAELFFCAVKIICEHQGLSEGEANLGDIALRELSSSFRFKQLRQHLLSLFPCLLVVHGELSKGERKLSVFRIFFESCLEFWEYVFFSIGCVYRED